MSASTCMLALMLVQNGMPMTGTGRPAATATSYLPCRPSLHLELGCRSRSRLRRNSPPAATSTTAAAGVGGAASSSGRGGSTAPDPRAPALSLCLLVPLAQEEVAVACNGARALLLLSSLRGGGEGRRVGDAHAQARAIQGEV